MNSQNVHELLGRFLVKDCGSENEFLAMMLLLHTHKIQFSRPVLDDRPAVYEISAITRRHASETAASVWHDRSDVEKNDPAFWFSLFKENTPFEIVEDIPEHWMAEVQKMRMKLLGHPDVVAVKQED